MKKRKIPERMCVGCKEKKPKREMVRVVRLPDGQVSLDFTGKRSGRGAYVCYNLSCFDRARKSKALEKALQVTIEDELWGELKTTLEDVGKERDKLKKE